MNDDTWADEPGARDFVKSLKHRRMMQVDALIGAAKTSQDPAIRQNWSAIAALDEVIGMIEEERGKPER